MKLYPHQEKALKQTKVFKRCAYYLDMGLGKTFVGSEKADQYKKKTLLICQKSKIEDWINHYHENYPLLPVFNLTNKKDVRGFNQCKGYSVGVINYDLVFRRDQYKKLEDFTLILDESSVIQNEKTERAKYILKLKPENVILLSGTPISGRYEHLWSQIRLLGWNIDYECYWSQYIDFEYEEMPNGYHLRKVTGYKNVDRLKEKLALHGAVFQKSEEVFDLPPQIFQDIRCERSSEYDEFAKNRLVVTDNGKEMVGDSTLKMFLYSRMLCGAYCPEKIKALRDLLLSTEKRLIIFYNFNDELEILLNLIDSFCSVGGEEYEDRHFSIFNGELKDLSQYEHFDDTITLIQYQAGAMGLNLQKANTIIYFTPPVSSELYEQSKKRIHRIGQESSCFYYRLVCKGSIEEKIYKTLEMRADYTDKLFEKDYMNAA